jgi:hypothetical protein
MEYYSAIKKNKIILFERTWMELEMVMSNEINQIQKDKYHMFSLICGTLKKIVWVEWGVTKEKKE